MTIQETGQIMDILEVAYPRFYASQTEEQRYKASALWATLLEPYPCELVIFATRRVVAESKYPPAISEVIERVKEAMQPQGDGAVDAWNILKKAACRASIVTREEYEALPYEVKRFCGGLSGLRDMGMLDSDILNTVTRGQFMKVYDGMRRSRETVELMPPELLELIDKTVPKKELPKPKQPEPAMKMKELRPAVEPATPEPPKNEEYEPLNADEWNARRNDLIARVTGAAV